MLVMTGLLLIQLLLTDIIDVGENATIIVTGPNDYNGTAVVNVDGKNYTVSISNGAGQLEVAGLANGTYAVKVTLLENDKYLGSECWSA